MGFTGTHGANARATRWDEGTGEREQGANWLPLEALESEELFAATPQLRAMPAPQRQVFAPGRTHGHTVPQTKPHPGRVARPERNPAEAGQAQAATTVKGVQARAVAILAAGLLCALALYVTVSAVIEWAQVKADDFQYGRPRTFQLDAYVGHGESEGMPSHFVAMNLNRRVTVLEMPGGDTGKVSTIIGPYLFGQGEDLTPVQASAQDVNGDGKADLVVTVKNEQLIYLNDGAGFKLMTAEERAALQKAQKTAGSTEAGTAAKGASK